jgi:hypothetical protein
LGGKFEAEFEKKGYDLEGIIGNWTCFHLFKNLIIYFTRQYSRDWENTPNILLKIFVY